MNILFKYTSRSRRDNFIRGYNSIINNINNKQNYHILISIDDDDATMKELKLKGNHTIISGISKSKIDAINRDLNSFDYNWDILINMSDDMIFTKQGFDDIIRSKFQETLNRSLLFHDGNRGDIITMSILGRDYYRQDGYIYHPDYKSLFCDNEATDVAKKRGCLIECPEKIISHLHPSYGKGKSDNQYTFTESFFNEDKKTYLRRKQKEFDLRTDTQLLEIISGVLYSTKETQMNSYNMGKYVVQNNIEGDIIECGIAMAGNFASMILGATSLANGKNRKFWGFDSFIGIQLAGKKDTQQAGIGDITHNTDVPYEDLLVSSGITVHPKEQVETHLSNWGLDKYQIELVEGWVQNSIPTINDRIEKIAILRLDMDVYHPTIYTLNMWWEKISVGGVIIIDDWALDGVRLACNEFFKEKNINPKIHTIENSTPIYFFKE